MEDFEWRAQHLDNQDKAWEDRQKRKAEQVNHPSHYNANPSGVECIDVIEWMSLNVGNAMKYLWRANEKGAPIQDLEKAAWYIQREIARLQEIAKPSR